MDIFNRKKVKILESKIVEILQQRLCRELAEIMFERKIVSYEVTNDPRTMSHIMHARIDIVNRG